MSGDNNKNKKDESGHPQDESSQTVITEQGKKKSTKNAIKAEEPEREAKQLSKILEIEKFMGVSGSLLSPLESKINEQHIDKILEIRERYDDKVFKDTQQSRKFMLLYILIGVALFVFLTLFLVGKDTELFKEILKLFISFVGGMGVGFGIKRYMEK